MSKGNFFSSTINEGSSTGGGSDPHWYPPNNNNLGEGADVTGVGGGAADGMIMSLSAGFRMFGENISAETEVEVFHTSAPSGTDVGVLQPQNATTLPSITTSFVPSVQDPGNPSEFQPAYIQVTWDVAPPSAKIWARGRNPDGNWVPYPITFLTGAG